MLAYPRREVVCVSEEVESALQSGRPVVALESTIISHGMPYPDNVRTARQLESIVRAERGVVPATIAILDGQPRVGLSDAELELLANSPGKVQKVARRDIAACISSRSHGGTTVSATMHLAAAAGIQILATGGIGGVHRGVSDTFDISADIRALSEIPVLVVCAGIKTILDVPKTLEALETASVPVITMSPVNGQFPGFYTQQSGVQSPHVVRDELEAATLFSTHKRVSSSGMLLAVPVPPAHAADGKLIADATSKAVAESSTRGLSGSEITPFLLSRVADLTQRQSLRANIGLVMNNAAVAARVALHLRDAGNEKDVQNAIDALENRNGLVGRVAHCIKRSSDVVVIGAVALDLLCMPTPGSDLIRETSNPGSVRQSLGGVACNIARMARMRGAHVRFCSIVGDDLPGKVLQEFLTQSGLDTVGVDVLPGGKTATYCAINSGSGNLDVAVAGMDIFDTSLPMLSTVERRLSVEYTIKSTGMLCIDGNLNISDMRSIMSIASTHNIPTWFEPTSVAKASKIVDCGECVFGALQYISPNINELTATWVALANSPWTGTDLSESRRPERLDDLASDVLRVHRGDYFVIVCTLGPQGLRLYRKCRGSVDTMDVPAAPVPGGRVISSSGAGDVLVGAMLARIVRDGHSQQTLLRAARDGVLAAAQCCASTEAVPDRLARL